MASVRFWNLPSWVEPRRALIALRRAAFTGGVSPAVKARAAELYSEQRDPVELPGFHVFDRALPVSPYTWLVPRPRGDISDLLNLWESYANQALGVRGGPSPLAAIEGDTLALTRADFKRFFGGPRGAGHWAAPAAKIIALAQHLEGRENLHIELSRTTRWERRKVLSIKMHAATCMLEVTPRGLWSNMAMKEIRAPYLASDAGIDEFCIRPFRTNHPLAVALMENEDVPETCLQAANVALRAIQQGLIREKDLVLSDALGRAASRTATVVSAIELLDRQRSLRPVYDLLVPNVVSALEFRRDFGNPFRPARSTRKETVDKWREQLFALVT